MAKQKAVASAEPVDTFERFARQWMERSDFAEITAAKNRWLLENYLFPHSGQRPIAEVQARERLAALRTKEARNAQAQLSPAPGLLMPGCHSAMASRTVHSIPAMTKHVGRQGERSPP
ncbi:phage integrase central domain-containing protein [Frateuria aurantia]|uniref:phage integrase central domain-containing protein n=1 Tax=Frateuria aurantia TaxID=81475 RepID=UPI0006936ACC|nr:hypothetical protein [Frateuria aurantia]